MAGDGGSGALRPGQGWGSGPAFNLTTPWRQGLFYGLLFAGSGASIPFIPLWFSQHGMSAGQIGLILALPLLGRALTGPLSGSWADRFHLYRTPLVILGIIGAAAYALMAPGTLYGGLSFPVFLLLYFTGYTALNSIGPLLDAMTLQLARTENFSYALARATGSAAFTFANVALGFILQGAGTWVVLLWIVAASVAAALGGRFLLSPVPRLERNIATPDRPRERTWYRMGRLMRNEGFWWLLLASGCLQAAHGFYYAFSTIIWQARDISAGVCGLLWATAIAGEIAFLTFGERLRHRLGPWRLLILAGGFGVVRWCLMALSPPLWLLWPLQLLHGFSFGAAYIAALELVYCLSPKGYEGLGQTVNSAYAAGVLTGIVTLVSGLLFERFGPYSYGLMAALAVTGTAAAAWMYSQRHRLLSGVEAA